MMLAAVLQFPVITIIKKVILMDLRKRVGFFQK